MRVIETARLLLEPQVAAHAEEMFAVLSDPAIHEFEGRPPESVEWLRARYLRLESRTSPDGTQSWLNWVVRVRGAGLIGYVQATVVPGGRAWIAYELASEWWGHGYGSEATAAMMAELVRGHGVAEFAATHKRDNERSRRLLERLGFVPAPADVTTASGIEPDEMLMLRPASPEDAQ